MVMMPEWYGISDGSLPARISFLSVSIWWMGFAGITFHYLPIMSFTRKGLYLKGLRSLELYWIA
jgi:UMF1 family MFS transporter